MRSLPTWLETYIDFNTHQRLLAGSSFLKDFFKLMDNSVLGKFQENLRKRQVELITDAGILRKRVAYPNFCSGNPINGCLTAIQCTAATLTLNRPIYMGFSVLDLSKLHMYNFHYNQMCVKYPHPGQLRLLTQTRIVWLMLFRQKISIEIWQRMLQLSMISMSTPLNHPLYSAINRKALGFFKGELKSVPMQRFVVLRPKRVRRATTCSSTPTPWRRRHQRVSNAG